MSGYTPGPWDYLPVAPDRYGHVRGIVHSPKTGVNICSLYVAGRKDDATTIPDARLIAAAPDLLAACKALIEWTDSMYPMWNMPHNLPIIGITQAAADAVAKAEGRDP